MTSPADRASSATAAAEPGPARGRYGPLVHLSRFDLAAEELTWQLPVIGELNRLMPGADRPDYSLIVLRRPVHFYPPQGFDLGRVDPAQRVADRKGRPMVRVDALLVCARFVGQQLHPGMVDLPVNVAFVIDNSIARDERVDFAKVEYAGVGYLTEGRSEQAAGTETAQETAGTETAQETAGTEVALTGQAAGTDVAREAAAVLRRGIEERRGLAVSRLSARLSLGEDHRLTGLTGNADGAAPEPTDETFARLNEVLARLGRDPETADIRAVRIRIGEGAEHVEVARG